tara:strand:- start:309 stop:632 length:324 start_codon:yes stop_codon:yes gene_type:complete
LRVLRILTLNPEITSRQIAQQVGISNGSAYYLLISFIDKGYVKLKNFKKNPKKVKYSYLLTPKGIREKSLLTKNFLARKKEDYKLLKEEIAQLERDVGMDVKLIDNE